MGSARLREGEQRQFLPPSSTVNDLMEEGVETLSVCLWKKGSLQAS